jgi:hypothetical protein
MRAVITDAAAGTDYAALVIEGRVQIWNAYGVALSALDDFSRPCAITARGEQLLVAAESGLTIVDVADRARPREVGSMQGLHGSRFVRSGVDGTIYLLKRDGKYAQLVSGERGWSIGAEFPTEPWTARAARSGRIVLHLVDSFGLEVLHVGELEPAAPHSPEKDTASPRC